MGQRLTLLEHFEAKVIRQDGCWGWSGFCQAYVSMLERGERRVG
jgi:hypothetical protein